MIVPLNSGGYRLGHSTVLAFYSVSEVLIVSGAVSLVMLSLQKTDTHWGEFCLTYVIYCLNIGAKTQVFFGEEFSSQQWMKKAAFFGMGIFRCAAVIRCFTPALHHKQQAGD